MGMLLGVLENVSSAKEFRRQIKWGNTARISVC